MRRSANTRFGNSNVEPLRPATSQCDQSLDDEVASVRNTDGFEMQVPSDLIGRYIYPVRPGSADSADKAAAA
jgi:hypothetical protein